MKFIFDGRKATRAAGNPAPGAAPDLALPGPPWPRSPRPAYLLQGISASPRPAPACAAEPRRKTAGRDQRPVLCRYSTWRPSHPAAAPGKAALSPKRSPQPPLPAPSAPLSPRRRGSPARRPRGCCTEQLPSRDPRATRRELAQASCLRRGRSPQRAPARAQGALSSPGTRRAFSNCARGGSGQVAAGHGGGLSSCWDQDAQGLGDGTGHGKASRIV